MTPSPTVSRFDRDTQFRPSSDGRFDVRIDPGWWIVNGPNGGYVAAILLRTLEAAVGDPERAPRSLTVHYLSPPAEGPAVVETRIERAGRSLTTVTGRLVQGDRVRALAIGAFSRPRPGTGEFDHAEMPSLPPPDALRAGPGRTTMAARYEIRFAPGAGPDGAADQPFVAGWIRPSEPRPVDYALVAAYCDALPPPGMVWREGGPLLGPLPTVDLTIHFRAPLPRAGCDAGDFCLAVFRSQIAREGFIEEDGEVWSRDGVLLAHSRQLAVVVGSAGAGGRT